VRVGELGLDGRVAASPGVLLAALHAGSQDRGLICPVAQGPEAAWAGNVEVLAAPDLLSLLNHFKGTSALSPPQPGAVEAPVRTAALKQVKGQDTAKRAIEIAAAGGHNLLMVGPPGAGKSLMASCLPGILPELTPGEALETSMVASVAGTLDGGRINTDFIDNSAGVDCSDHEVNIKILLGAVQEAGALTQDSRNELLASMTDEVGQRLPVGHRLAAVHGQMGDHPQDAGLKFPVEAVHHRQHGNQNGDAEHQPERGDQGDHGDKTIAGPGAGVAQTHEQGKGSKHGAHLSTKTAACASRFVTTIRDRGTAI